MTELISLSDAWMQWQIRSFVFVVLVLWLAQGAGLRSPIERCLVLIIGTWLLLLMPLIVAFGPALDVPVSLGIGELRSLLVLSPQTQAENLQFVVEPILLLIFVAVGGVLLIPGAASVIRLANLHRSLQRSEKIELLFNQCRSELGVRKNVICYTSALAPAPLTYGFIRYVIVLPEGAESWTQQQLRICLTHELLHVQRGDWLSQQAVSILLLMMALNPFVWKLRRDLLNRMEESVDKLSLDSGIDARDYAMALVRQTRQLKSGAGLFVPTYFGEHRYGSSQLQQRVGSVIAEPYGWRPASRGECLRLALVMAGLCGLIATVQPHIVEPVVSENTRPTYEYLVWTDAIADQPVRRTEVSLSQSDSSKPVSPEPLPPAQTAQVKLADLVDVDEKQVWVEVVSDRPLPEIKRGTVTLQAYVDHALNLVSEELARGDFREALVETDIQSVESALGKLRQMNLPVQPRAIVEPLPEYPQWELRRNREGWVSLAFDLNERGEVADVLVIDSSGSRYFERSAIRALKQSRYDLGTAPEANLITRDLTQNYTFKIVEADKRGVGRRMVAMDHPPEPGG